jgi:hypothetical protein
MDKAALFEIAGTDDRTLIECLLTAHASSLHHARKLLFGDRGDLPSLIRHLALWKAMMTGRFAPANDADLHSGRGGK